MLKKINPEHKKSRRDTQKTGTQPGKETSITKYFERQQASPPTHEKPATQQNNNAVHTRPGLGWAISTKYGGSSYPHPEMSPDTNDHDQPIKRQDVSHVTSKTSNQPTRDQIENQHGFEAGDSHVGGRAASE